MSVNKAIIKGRLGADVDLRFMQDNRGVANFNVACGERWKDKQTGEVKEHTEWMRVVAFGKLAEVLAKHFSKGSEIYIEGKIRTRKWQGQDGQDRYSTEIVADTFDFCGSSQSGSGDARAQQQAAAYGQSSGAPASDPNSPPTSAYAGMAPAGDDFDDDIPFASLNWQIRRHLI